MTILVRALIRKIALCGFLMACGMTVSATPASADVVSFLVDPATFDSNSDGFITGHEFQPMGTDGTVFDLEPTLNLVGADRFLLNLSTGLHFGGGGGSTIEFEFSVDKDLTLDSYTLSSAGFILGNPVFDIRENSTVLSSGNTAIASGDTHNFAGGPITLDAGTVYTFEATTFGAATQSFMAAWNYTPSAIPEPGSATCLGLAGLVLLGVRRRRPELRH